MKFCLASNHTPSHLKGCATSVNSRLRTPTQHQHCRREVAIVSGSENGRTNSLTPNSTEGSVMIGQRPSMAWGVLLAGGDGTRLQSRTTRIEGDTRPKQFCRMLGNETLLTQTRRRISPLFGSDKMITVVTKQHEKFYSHELNGWPHTTVVAQTWLESIPGVEIPWRVSNGIKIPKHLDVNMTDSPFAEESRKLSFNCSVKTIRKESRNGQH